MQSYYCVARYVAASSEDCCVTGSTGKYKVCGTVITCTLTVP